MKEQETMKEQEKIKVFVDVVNGETVCICKRSRRGCNKPCEPDEVTRDKFKGWESTMHRNRYGGG